MTYDPEKRREKYRANYAENRERIRTYQNAWKKRYYAEHKELYKEKRRAYYIANREKLREYYAANREKFREYYAAHRDEIKAQRIRREREKENTGISAGTR